MNEEWENFCRDMLAGVPMGLALARLNDGDRMSIQIRDMANAAARKEVRERIGGLNLAREIVWHDRNDTPEARAEAVAQYHEQLKSFYFALTGSYPTHDEMKEMLASDMQEPKSE